MNALINEKISAYFDGEATAEEVENATAALLRDPALRSALSRHHWVRHALRDSRPVAPAADFSARVLAGLDSSDNQDGVDGPNEAPVWRPNIVPLRAHKTARPRWRRRQTAGLAVAASLVGAVVLVNNPFAEAPTAAHSPAPAPIQQASLLPAQTQQVALQQPQPQQQRAQARDAADHWTVSDPNLQNQLNGYLLEHDGLARSYGFSGATPSLVRAVTYTQVND